MKFTSESFTLSTLGNKWRLSYSTDAFSLDVFIKNAYGEETIRCEIYTEDGVTKQAVTEAELSSLVAEWEAHYVGKDGDPDALPSPEEVDAFRDNYTTFERLPALREIRDEALRRWSALNYITRFEIRG